MDHRETTLRRALSSQIENVAVLSLTGSTHAIAKRLIGDMDEEKRKLGPSVIVALRQDAGEGRGDRSWQEPRHGLFLNWLRSGIERDTLSLLPVLAATAARRAIAAAGVADTAIKWPNDILVGGRKIAGLLVFARHGEDIRVTVGLGVNLVSAPTIDDVGSIRATAVSDHSEKGGIEDWREEIARSFVGHLDRSITRPGPGLADWREHLLQKPGHQIVVRLASGERVSGIVSEITGEGFLRIRADGGERLITGGDLIES